MNDPILDSLVLEELRATGGDELITELAALFRCQATQSERDLRLAASTRDLSAVKRIAHTLVGSASALGGCAVEVMAREIEALARLGEPAVFDRLPLLAERVEHLARALELHAMAAAPRT